MTRQQRLTLIATILGSTVVFLDGTIVNVALPSLGRELNAGLAGQQWVLEAYMLTMVSLLLVGGSLGDQFGRRRLFVIGLIAFGATSILCALAPTEEFLIGARALQGIAGALLVPGSLAIVAATFEGESRGQAVGTWTAWTGIATVFGPAGGGALVGLISWRAIFWVNIPLIAATVTLALRVIEESSDPDAFPGIDVPGVLLSAAGLAGPVFALIEQPTHGWGDPLVWVPLIAGVACFVSFVLWEMRAARPMLDLSLFRIRNFAVANVTTLTLYAGLGAGLLFVGLYLQQVVGYTPFEAGLATMPISLCLFFLSPRFGKLAAEIGPRLPMTVGPLVAGTGMLLFMRLNPGASYPADVLPSVLLFGLGMSMTVAPLTATVLDSVSPRRVGIASGINNGVSRVAGLLAIAVLGAVISAHFGARLDNYLSTHLDLGIEPSVAETRATAAAIEEAKEQPLGVPDTSELSPLEKKSVIEGSKDASTSAFHLGALLAGVLMIAGGVASAAGIRNPKRKGDDDGPPGRDGPGGEATDGAGPAEGDRSPPADAPAPAGQAPAPAAVRRTTTAPNAATN
jgi:EmrB/QacA subfamily drug resistance transporter